MLSEERKTQLDEIVGLMSNKGENDETIQFVVDDFKSKYESESPQQPQGLIGGAGFATGFTKGLLGTAFGAGRFGTKVGRALLPKALEPDETIFEREKPQFLEPKGGAERLGAGAETLAEFAVPIGGVAKIPGVARGIGKTVGGGAKLASESVLGTEGLRAVGTGLSKPDIQSKILRGEITTGTIAKKIGGFAKKAQEKSREALTSARGAITGTSKRDVISKNVRSLLKKEKAERVLLGEEETLINKLNKLVNREIGGRGSIPKKDIDTLIKTIDDAGFFKTGAVSDKFRNSNKIVNSVRSLLRNETKKGNPKFEKLLEKASKEDIPFFEKLGKNIVGKEGQLNVDLLQNKVNSLVNAIDDPNKKAESIRLLKELSKRVGAKADFIDELEVFSRTKPLTTGLTGISSPFKTAQELAGQGLAKGARGLGRIGKKFR